MRLLNIQKLQYGNRQVENLNSRTFHGNHGNDLVCLYVYYKLFEIQLEKCNNNNNNN